MDIIEVKDMLIRGHLILTYQEWYAINRDAFELVHNGRLPWDLYQEYVDEKVANAYKIMNDGT